ncbi:Pyridine nucleotide-disulphide oxidoreductase [Seinonella peptonophila]|uniref:Pyridine nucleotide-disulphide oxidoreductase n=1 Tax=Seinonella peptonophila TaxID=112248 RepID=A0A1M4U1V0_9BACL|nr:NAD(P)/FAD-dependent oxidoreductase [Seinonella peptonophila]SHE50587.1 Pyridine nucleotide-disulphide oxidoreductase [Seinonella peptonophila]
MYDVLIVGAASAGTSAGLFLAKAGKKTILVDSDQSGTKMALIKNHYGVLETTGPELLEIGIKQAKQFGAKVVKDKVTAIEKIENGFLVKTEQGEYEAHQVIIATGKVMRLAKSLGLQLTDRTDSGIKAAIQVDHLGKTSVEGIWAAGQAGGTSSHTIITAGDGARIAVHLLGEWDGKRYVDHDAL